MASASFNPLNDHGCEDRFSAPVVLPGERYVFETPYIILLKDKAQAATNAIKEVFPDSEIHECMCMTHASIIWMSKNTHKFCRPDVHRPECIADLNYRYKVLGHVNLVKVARRLMLEKWVQVYKEPQVAHDWRNSWGEDILTRVESNQQHLCPLRGAIPCDNNALEAGNAADKESLVYRKASLFEFAGNLETSIIAPASKQDTMFEGRLKGRSNNQLKMNLAVYNIKYFEQCRHIERADARGKPTFLHLCWNYTDEENDVPKGSYLLAGRHCLTEMRSYAGIEEDLLCKKACRRWLGGHGSDKWVNIYKRIIREPEYMSSDPCMTFDVLCGWDKCFHIIRPIVPDDGPVEEAIKYYVDWMTNVNKFPMVSAREVIARGEKGLVSCNCFAYQHYCFCKHTFLILRKRGIYFGYPPTMDPIPVNKRKREGLQKEAGAPKHAVRGEALNTEG